MEKGISLIVLVITIIVIIILAGSVILSLSQNNPILQSKQAAFKSTAETYNSELTLAISSKYVQNPSFTPSLFNAGIWNGIDANKLGTVKEYISSITAADGIKYEIQGGRLVYTGSDLAEKAWLTEIGITNTTSKLYTIVKPDLADVNKYKTPYIPTGFAYKEGTWDTGLVIQDTSFNEYVWVPVDGTNVPYAKWCTSGIVYNDATILDDTLPSGVVESTQITNYGGFYIGRYEAMFDYNSGSIRASSKKSMNKTLTLWTRDIDHTGYLWNFVSYIDAKNYSENMATSYGYNTSKVVTHLATGLQWDTTMKWIQYSGKSITDTRTWGNHSDSQSPANIIGFGSLQVSGFNENWEVNNIYDLAGNIVDLTNEKYNITSIIGRGGNAYNSGSSVPASYRSSYATNFIHAHMGFRVALYIK
jgi:hypothetical protein